MLRLQLSRVGFAVLDHISCSQQRVAEAVVGVVVGVVLELELELGRHSYFDT